MADFDRQLTAYEVRCPGCDVTFPPGTRQCIHCGSRIGRPRLLGGSGELQSFEGGDPFPESHAPESDTEPSGGRGLRIGFTLVWLVLAVVTAAMRACQGGNGP